MGHMQASYAINIPKAIYRETSFRSYRGSKHGDFNLAEFRVRSWNTHKVRKREKRNLERETDKFMVQYYTSSSSSSSSSSTEDAVDLNGRYGKGQFGELVREYGWRVRRMVEEKSEIGKVAQVQAEAFHVPVAIFNHLFFQFFQAEVLAGLLYRLRNSPPDRYACLVAESKVDGVESRQELVGVVDVTVLRDEAVLQHLPGAEEYLYVSGIAVLNNFRRRKVATALLKACDMVSILWGFEYLVLRAYEDDLGALKLYGNAGYTIVSADPPWTTTWIGRKRRVLMIKRPISRSK